MCPNWGATAPKGGQALKSRGPEADPYTWRGHPAEAMVWICGCGFLGNLHFDVNCVYTTRIEGIVHKNCGVDVGVDCEVDCGVDFGVDFGLDVGVDLCVDLGADFGVDL